MPAVERGADGKPPIKFQYKIGLFGQVETKISKPETPSDKIPLRKLVADSGIVFIQLIGLMIGTMAAKFLSGKVSDVSDDRIPTAETVNSL